MLNTFSNSFKYLSFLMAAFLFIVVQASCSKKLTFATSNVVPGAKGSVKIKKDENKNNLIDLQVTHLTNPSRLQPSKNAYVVWMETENNGIKNIGQLRTSTGVFSNTSKGSLTTVTSFTPRKFFITAEDRADIQFPGTQTVLTTP